MKQKMIYSTLFLILLSSLLISPIFSQAEADKEYPEGQITGFRHNYNRAWGAWVCSDINGDNWPEIMICGAIFTQCFDVNPDNDGPKILWELGPLHHEVFWGFDTGIDVNGDGITEQFVFESVFNYQYLIDGKTGKEIHVPDFFLYCPGTHGGIGLGGVDVNGNGIGDCAIVGINAVYSEPVLICFESTNASKIWERILPASPIGVYLLNANGTRHILTTSSKTQIWNTNGDLKLNITQTNPGIITNGAGIGHDMLVYSNQAFNASTGALLWTSDLNIGVIADCGDINNDGINDAGGLLGASDRVGIISGKDGISLRNHTAQDLENVMHGIIGVGDLDEDNFDDYGIFGDFKLVEIFSGRTGVAILQMDTPGAEDLYPVKDINNNGYSDIMMLTHGIIAFDGSAHGYIDAVEYFLDTPDEETGDKENDESAKSIWFPIIVVAIIILPTILTIIVVILKVKLKKMKAIMENCELSKNLEGSKNSEKSIKK